MNFSWLKYLTIIRMVEINLFVPCYFRSALFAFDSRNNEIEKRKKKYKERRSNISELFLDLLINDKSVIN